MAGECRGLPEGSFTLTDHQSAASVEAHKTRMCIAPRWRRLANDD